MALQGLRGSHCVVSTCRLIASRAISDRHTPEPRPFSDIPGPSGKYNLPIIGPAFHFKPLGEHTFERMDVFYKELHDNYGPVVKVNLGETMLLLDTPADMETALRSEGRYPDHLQIDMMLHYYEKNKLIKPLSMSSGETWQKLRSKVQKKYTRPRAALVYLRSQGKVADELIRHIEESQITGLDWIGIMTGEKFEDICFRYVTESLCMVFFNKRLGFLAQGAEYEAEKQRLIQETRNLFEVMAKPPGLPFYKIFPTADYKKLATALDYLTGESCRYVLEAYEDNVLSIKDVGLVELDEDDPNLLVALLGSEELSINEIYNVMTENIYAGTDATTKTLLLFLLNLARNPDKQEKLYEEIQSVVGVTGDLTEANFHKLKYLSACLKESMRMAFSLPAGPTRTLPNDCVIAGYKIPKGTNFMLSCNRLLRNEEYFKDPDSFVPERWLRAGEAGERDMHIPTVALLPFGFGPRICLGRRFAEQIIFLATVKILANFHVSLAASSKPVQIIYQIFATTDRPVEFAFEKRNPQMPT